VLAPDLYSPVFFNSVLLLTVAVCLRLRGGRIGGAGAAQAFWVVGLAVTLFLGLRPVAVQFGDTMNYAAAYANLAQGEEPPYEWGFTALMRLCAGTLPVEGFLLLCTCVYVLPLLYAVDRRHRPARLEVLVAFVGAFSFYAYAVNGVRSGMAASLFIAAVAADDRTRRIALMMAAASVHKSTLLMVATWIATGRVTNPRAWSAAWWLALAASIVAGASVSGFLSSLPGLASDERVQVYLGTDREEASGLRLDFVLYSIAPLLATERLAGPRILLDPFYVRLRNLYLGLNAFWLLTMYAAFTNRFAYLSWSMLPWVLVYPFVPRRRRGPVRRDGGVEPRRLDVLAGILLAGIAFTYLMMMVVYPGRER